MNVAGALEKISKRVVDGAQPPTDGEVFVWDSLVKGFFVRIYATGRKVYGVKFRVKGRQRIHTIGVHGSPWTPEEARSAAIEVLRQAKAGEDPNALKRETRFSLTVADLIKLYLSEGPATKPTKRAISWTTDASNLNRHILPLIGKKDAGELTKAEAMRALADIEAGKTAKVEKTSLRGRARITGGAGIAKRTGAIAAAMYSWAMEHNHLSRPENPFAKRNQESGRVLARFMTTAEMRTFHTAISTLQSAGAISETFADAILLLMLTGARKTEILGLRWDEWNPGRNMLTLPPERTKAGGKTGERRILLAPDATALLERRRMQQVTAGNSTPKSEYVFPSAKGDGHAVGLRRAFKKVCDEAGLRDFRIHDLRHSFASFAIADGASLFLTGKLLGHSSTRSTERYAHLADDPLVEAVARIGARLGS